MSALSAREHIESWVVAFFDWVNPHAKSSFWLFVLLFVCLATVAFSALEDPDSSS